MWEEATNKQKWNESVGSQAKSRFLQSWQWGEFQKSWGRPVLRLSWNDEVLAQAIKMPLALGKYYWYIPHGPVFIKAGVPGWSGPLAEKLSDGALFSRVDPINDLFLIKGAKTVSATQPQCTRILDLSKSEDELLVQMHQKTRYNIKVAEKNSVVVRAGSIENFLKLYHQTAKRDKFKKNPDNWLSAMARHLSGQSGASIKIWIASYNAEPVAASMTAYFGDTVTYLHGASANEQRNVMAPYLLHWEIIKDAKKAGYHYYDWRGVNPEESNHSGYKKSWAGITRFKAGFGGEVVCYPDSFDLIYRPWWYRVYKILSRVKRSI